MAKLFGNTRFMKMILHAIPGTLASLVAFADGPRVSHEDIPTYWKFSKAHPTRDSFQGKKIYSLLYKFEDPKTAPGPGKPGICTTEAYVPAVEDGQGGYIAIEKPMVQAPDPSCAATVAAGRTFREQCETPEQRRSPKCIAIARGAIPDDVLAPSGVVRSGSARPR